MTVARPNLRVFEPLNPLVTVLASLAQFVTRPSRIWFGADSFEGAQIAGYSGGGWFEGGRSALTLEGTYTPVTPASGAQAGTAGAGTTTTSVVKPTAAVNWPAGPNTFRGSFLMVTGGGGYNRYSTVLRPILSNTVSTLTVHAIDGMDSTTTFAIVDLGTTITRNTDDPAGTDMRSCVQISDNALPIVLRGLKFDSTDCDHLVISQHNADVTLDGCVFDAGLPLADFWSQFDSRVTITNCIFRDNSGALVLDSGKEVEATNLLLWDGQVRCERVQNVYATVEAQECTGEALYIDGAPSVRAEVNANACTATPVYLEAVGYFEPIGNRLTGSGNTGAGTYGISIQKAGRYLLTGCTITGAAGDVLLGSDIIPWATLTSLTYGAAQRYGSTLIADAGESKALTYGNYTFMGNADFSGRILLYGYFNVAVKLGAPTDAAGSGAGDATDLAAEGALSFAQVTTSGAGQGVKLPGNAAIAGHQCTVYNSGLNTLNVYPPAGGLIDGLASVTIAAGKVKTFVSLNADSGKDYVTVSAT